MREVLIGGELVQVHPIIEGLADANHEIATILDDISAGLTGLEEVTIGNVNIQIESTYNDLDIQISFADDYAISINMLAGQPTEVTLIYNGANAKKAEEIQKIEMGTTLGSVLKMPRCLAAAADFHVTFDGNDSNEYWEESGVFYSTATLVDDYKPAEAKQVGKKAA